MRIVINIEGPIEPTLIIRKSDRDASEIILLLDGIETADKVSIDRDIDTAEVVVRSGKTEQIERWPLDSDPRRRYQTAEYLAYVDRMNAEASIDELKEFHKVDLDLDSWKPNSDPGGSLDSYSWDLGL